MSAQLGSAGPSSIAHTTPVFGRAALAILGSMLLLIVALTVLLVQSTWTNPASGTAAPPALDQGGFGS